MMPIIKIENLAKALENNIILNNITADINKGEIISIIGPSETAKNMFLKSLNLSERPTSGSIIINGQDLLNSKTDILKMRQKIGMVFKNFNLYSHLTVIENITLAPMHLLKISKKKAYEEAMQLLQNIGLGLKAYALPDELTDCEKQRVAIVRTLAMKPAIILFEEPAKDKDSLKIDWLINTIKSFAQNGMAIVMITDNMEFAKTISSRVFYLDEGCIYEEGTSRDIFEYPKREKTKVFIERISAFSKIMSPENVDISMLNEEIADFCYENYVNKQKILNVQLIVEEIIWNILFPAFTDKSNELKFDFSVNHKRELIEIIFTYDGKPYDDCLNADTVIPQKLIERKAQSIDPTIENGLNKLTVKVNTNEFVRHE